MSLLQRTGPRPRHWCWSADHSGCGRPEAAGLGMTGVFSPGSPMQDIIDFIQHTVSACERAEAFCEPHGQRLLLLADDSVTIQRVIELTFAHEDVRVAP